MDDFVISETREVYATDRLAKEKNIATNGRLFCFMLFFIALAAFMDGYGAWYGRIAVLAALPVGLSCIIDQMQAGRPRLIATLCTYSIAAIVALILFINLG